MILAVDIGGTKFSLAAFDGGRMVRRESRATDAAPRPRRRQRFVDDKGQGSLFG